MERQQSPKARSPKRPKSSHISANDWVKQQKGKKSIGVKRLQTLAELLDINTSQSISETKGTYRERLAYEIINSDHPKSNDVRRAVLRGEITKGMSNEAFELTLLTRISEPAKPTSSSKPSKPSEPSKPSGIQDVVKHVPERVSGAIVSGVEKKVDETIEQGKSKIKEKAGEVTKGLIQKGAEELGKTIGGGLGEKIAKEGGELAGDEAQRMIDRTVDRATPERIPTFGRPAVDRPNESKRDDIDQGLDDMKHDLDTNRDRTIEDRELREAGLNSLLLGRVGSYAPLLAGTLASYGLIGGGRRTFGKRENIPLVDTRRGISNVKLVQRAVNEYRRDRDVFAVEIN